MLQGQLWMLQGQLWMSTKARSLDPMDSCYVGLRAPEFATFIVTTPYIHSLFIQKKDCVHLRCWRSCMSGVKSAWNYFFTPLHRFFVGLLSPMSTLTSHSVRHQSHFPSESASNFPCHWLTAKIRIARGGKATATRIRTQVHKINVCLLYLRH